MSGNVPSDGEASNLRDSLPSDRKERVLGHRSNGPAACVCDSGVTLKGPPRSPHAPST